MHKLVSRSELVFDLNPASLAVDPQGKLALFNAVMRAAARSDPYGRDPHDPTPPLGWAPYNPEYVALLYLRLDPNWKVTVNHACYRLGAGNTAPGRLGKAVDVFSDKVDRNVAFGHPDLRQHAPYQHLLPPADAGHDPNRPYDSGWFKDFKFALQNEIFIYIHHPGTVITLYEDALLNFKIQGSDGMPRHQNYAFFHARVVDDDDIGELAADGTMIRLENYATKENGSLLQAAEKRDYSIDIKFQIDGGDAGLITMVVDPDTGNGAGNEP